MDRLPRIPFFLITANPRDANYDAFVVMNSVKHMICLNREKLGKRSIN